MDTQKIVNYLTHVDLQLRIYHMNIYMNRKKEECPKSDRILLTLLMHGP